MKRVAVGAAMMAASFVLIASPASAARLDFGKQTWNILPPGQSGALPPDRHSTDQLKFYDRLTALFDGVTARDCADALASSAWRSSAWSTSAFHAPTGSGGDANAPARRCSSSSWRSGSAEAPGPGVGVGSGSSRS